VEITNRRRCAAAAINHGSCAGQECGRFALNQLEVLPAPTPTMTMKSIALKNIDNSTKSDMRQHRDTQKYAVGLEIKRPAGACY
jgi:hypothetical protein